MKTNHCQVWNPSLKSFFATLLIFNLTTLWITPFRSHILQSLNHQTCPQRLHCQYAPDILFLFFPLSPPPPLSNSLLPAQTPIPCVHVQDTQPSPPVHILITIQSRYPIQSCLWRPNNQPSPIKQCLKRHQNPKSGLQQSPRARSQPRQHARRPKRSPNHSQPQHVSHRPMSHMAKQVNLNQNHTNHKHLIF